MADNATSHVMWMETPLGPDALQFRSMGAQEALGQLFQFDVKALSEQNDISANELLGKNVSVFVELPEGGKREFNGIVTCLRQIGFVGRLSQYHLTLNPWLWLLTRNEDCRIFQNQTVPDVIKKVFADYPHDLANRLKGSYSVGVEKPLEPA